MMNELLILIAIVFAMASCATDRPGDVTSISTESTGTRQEFPDIEDGEATRHEDGTFTFSVTISSPYDTPERYADAWRIVAPDGEVLGVRELLHDHSTEQPFTRSLIGVEIPPGVETVTIEGRDLVNGWGGTAVELALVDS